MKSEELVSLARSDRAKLTSRENGLGWEMYVTDPWAGAKFRTVGKLGIFRSGDRWVIPVPQPDDIDGVYLPVGTVVVGGGIYLPEAS